MSKAKNKAWAIQAKREFLTKGVAYYKERLPECQSELNQAEKDLQEFEYKYGVEITDDVDPWEHNR